MWRDLYLIRSPRKCADGDIRSHFFVKIWLNLFIVFSSGSIKTIQISNQSMQHQPTVWLYWFLPVLLDRFWKNVTPIYPVSIKAWLFSFRTKYVSQTNRFGIYWLKPFGIYWLKPFIKFLTCFLFIYLLFFIYRGSYNNSKI